MPKIFQINSNLNSGAAGRIVEQIGVQVLKNGWQSYVAYGRQCNKSESETIKIGNKLDVLCHGFKSLLLDKHGLGSKNATIDLIRRIDEIDPDIIHLHGIHGYYINIEVLFSYLSKINKPIVWTMHDFWPITGHCSYFSDIKCEKWKQQCFSCPKYRIYPTSLFIDRSTKNFQLKKSLFTAVSNMIIISVSNWMGGLMKQSFLREFPQKVILNGVDVNEFMPISNNRIKEKYNIGDKFMLLGVATSWSTRKGWNDYMNLADSLSDDYQLVMIGLNEKQLKKINNKIIGIKRTESVFELAEYYTAADVVLSLSSQETFGLTTIEGFACGTPSIVYNCTASPELITPETGMVVEKGDLKQLVSAIETIKALGKSHFSKSCRERAKSVYDINLRYKEYIEIYNMMLTKNTPKKHLNK